MRITLKLFALLGAYLPPGSAHNEAVIEVPEGATVASVIEGLRLPPGLTHLVLLNGTYVPPDARAATVLAEGDALAVWPPIAGG